MSYRFKLERRHFAILYARQCVSDQSQLWDRLPMRVPRNIIARVHRAKYYERRWNLRKNVTSRYDKSSTCHAQIQFYEARSRWMEVHRQCRGTPRNTLGLRHDGGWIPPGVQAFGDLARQPWSPLDGGRGMYTGVVGRVAWDTLSRTEIALRASDGNETRRIPDLITENVTRHCSICASFMNL